MPIFQDIYDDCGSTALHRLFHDKPYIMNTGKCNVKFLFFILSKKKNVLVEKLLLLVLFFLFLRSWLAIFNYEKKV